MKIDAEAYRRLIDIGLALSAEKDTDGLLERILVEAKTMVNADAGTLYVVAPGNQLTFAIVLNDTLRIHEGGPNGSPITMPHIPLKTVEGEFNLGSIAAIAANRGETICIDDESDMELVDAKQFDQMTGYESRSFLAVPLKNFAEETIGVLQLINAKDESGGITAFTDDTIPMIEALASQASVALENRYLLDEHSSLRRQLENEVDARTEELKNALSKLSEAHIILKDLTTIDAVTGIRNRQYFDDVFDQEWRRGVRQRYPITLMLIDIDHFKRVNDTYGHLAGDECLASVARTIDSQFNRPSDVVARYGGEEFIVILPYVEEENSNAMADQVRSHIENMTFSADGHEIGVTISIGRVTLVPQENMSRREMIAKADKALYKAKASGRNRVCCESDIEA